MAGENETVVTTEADVAAVEETVEATTEPTTENTAGGETVAVEGGEATSPEAPKEETKPEPNDDIAARAKQLMRREGDLVRLQQKLASERREIEGIKQSAAQFASLREQAKADPLAALASLGVKVDDVKARIAEAESTDPNAVLRRKVEEMERMQREAREQAQREAQQREVEARRAEHYRSLASHIKANPEKYELINAYGDQAITLVQKHILRHLEKTNAEGAPRLLTHDEAAQAVEAYLEKQYVEPALRAKKVVSKLALKAPPAPAKKPESPQIGNDLVPSKTVVDNDEGMRPGETIDDYYLRLKKKWNVVPA